jgi:hypothetical protein
MSQDDGPASPDTADPSAAPSATPRARWVYVGIGTAVVVVVVVLALIFVGIIPSPFAPQGAAKKGTPVGSTGSIVVHRIRWSTVNDSVVVVPCAVCNQSIAEGGTFNVSLDVQPTCDPLGCAATVRSVTFAPPFQVRSTSPSLPGNFVSGNAAFRVELIAPSDPGNYTLQGFVNATAVPPCYAVRSQSWSVVDLDSNVSALHVSATGVPTNVTPGSTFTSQLTITNPSPLAVAVNATDLPSGFVAVSTTPTLPVLLASGAYVQLKLVVRAPDVSGSGALAGTVQAFVFGTLNLSTTVTLEDNPFVQPSLSVPATATGLVPNGTFEVNVTVQRSPSSPYELEFSGIRDSGGIVLLNSSLAGPQNVNASNVVFTFQVRYSPTTDLGWLVFTFTEIAEG